MAERCRTAVTANQSAITRLPSTPRPWCWTKPRAVLVQGDRMMAANSSDGEQHPGAVPGGTRAGAEGWRDHVDGAHLLVSRRHPCAPLGAAGFTTRLGLRARWSRSCPGRGEEMRWPAYSGAPRRRSRPPRPLLAVLSGATITWTFSGARHGHRAAGPSYRPGPLGRRPVDDDGGDRGGLVSAMATRDLFAACCTDATDLATAPTGPPARDLTALRPAGIASCPGEERTSASTGSTALPTPPSRVVRPPCASTCGPRRSATWLPRGAARRAGHRGGTPGSTATTLGELIARSTATAPLSAR